MMDVSVIIVNYNTLEMTRSCIDSVFERTKGLDFEVILVDNGSSDGSKEFFEGDSRIKYIYSSKNLGFGRANNLGYNESQGEFIFLLNSDTLLVNNAIYLLWESFVAENKRNAGRIACAGCILYDANGSITHSYAKFPQMHRSILDFSFYALLYNLRIIKERPNTSNYMGDKDLSAVIDVDYVTGADLMVCRDVIEKYGLFDEFFFMYYEETEMQFRYMKKGFRRIIVPGPQIIHLEGKSNQDNSPRRMTMVIKSIFLYYKKTHSRMSYIIFSILFKTVYFLSRIVYYPFVKGTVKDKWQHIVTVLKY